MLHCSRDHRLLENLSKRRQLSSIKPIGIWYSPLLPNNLSEWQVWCESTGYGTGEYLYEIVPDYAKVLIVEDLSSLENLFKTYTNSKCIDWSSVSRDYTGIEFRNFARLKQDLVSVDLASKRWPLKLLVLSLDCNSGCIWHPNALKLNPLC